MRDTVDSVLSDRFMVFLSLCIVPVIIIPLLVSVPPSGIAFLNICDWSIIVLFVAEYASKLYLAKDRWAHFKEPWHLVDLAIVVLPFIQYLPFLGIATTGSPSLLLRLLRLPRVIAVSGRAADRRMEEEQAQTVEKKEEGGVVIRMVDSKSLTVASGLTWDELRDHVADPNEEWIDIHNLSDSDVRTLSSILHVPEPHFKIDLMDEIFPHIDYVQRVSLIFLQLGSVKYPEEPEAFLTISRSGIIIICTGQKIISVSRRESDLFNSALASVDLKSGLSFVVAVLYALLDQTLKEYRSLLSEIEIEVIRIGSTPRSKLPRDFLQRIYGLNSEVSRVKSNLVHLKDLLGVIVASKVPLEGFDDRAEEDFHVLQDSVSYLNDIADDLAGNIHSIIDLYINQTSFDTNRILKILAVITSIGVIPSAVGGILGMNLLGTPYPAYLWEVLLGIGIAMAFVSYVFIKLGWLRS